MPDIFGDLREWGRVLQQIELLRLAGQLDEHEEGLTRVLRYRYNWQLREAALRAVPDLGRPSKEFLEVLLRIVTDDYCEMETRLLACEAVRCSISKPPGPAGSGDFEAEATRYADEILRVTQPPVLRKAVEKWLAHASAEQTVKA